MTRKQIFFLTAFLLISGVIFLVIYLIGQNLKPNKQINTVPLINSSTTIFTLDQTDPQIAKKNKDILLPKLPIEIRNFATSVNINTDILITSVPNDSPESVRIEFFGLDYQYDQNDPKTNPNMIAYQESFNKVKSILQENNVKITDLRVVLSNKKYIRDIATDWINTLQLLP